MSAVDTYGHGTGALFDLDAAQRAGVEGMERAGHRAYDWSARAADHLEYLARTGRAFTADDLTAAVGLPSVGPGQNNAVGAAFAAARKRGVIVRVGYMPSKRITGHGRVVAIWQGNPDFER